MTPDDHRPSMRLVPESVAALSELDGDLLDRDAVVTALSEAADAVVALVPDCVGMSVTVVHDGRSVTLLATGTGVAALDALQYLDDGPCESSVREGVEIDLPDLSDPLSEQRWSAFARAAAASGVRSSLSLPLRAGGEVVGGVNLYGATTDAFDREHRRVAGVFGAHAAEVVANADLPMRTAERARRAERDLRDQAVVDQAVGVLVAQRRITVDAAESALLDAAARAGVSPAKAAALVVELRPGIV